MYGILIVIAIIKHQPVLIVDRDAQFREESRRDIVPRIDAGVGSASCVIVSDRGRGSPDKASIGSEFADFGEK